MSPSLAAARAALTSRSIEAREGDQDVLSMVEEELGARAGDDVDEWEEAAKEAERRLMEEERDMEVATMSLGAAE